MRHPTEPKGETVGRSDPRSHALRHPSLLTQRCRFSTKRYLADAQRRHLALPCGVRSPRAAEMAETGLLTRERLDRLSARLDTTLCQLALRAHLRVGSEAD